MELDPRAANEDFRRKEERIAQADGLTGVWTRHEALRRIKPAAPGSPVEWEPTEPIEMYPPDGQGEDGWERLEQDVPDLEEVEESLAPTERYLREVGGSVLKSKGLLADLQAVASLRTRKATPMSQPELDQYTTDPIDSWTLAPTRRYFAWCDACNVFRLWGDYFETYRHTKPTGERTGSWWWECERCLMASITRVAEKAQHVPG